MDAGGGLLATRPPHEALLYHKTTNRVAYEDAVATRPGFEDVLLTPPISSGLLPGTLRAHLLDEGKIREKAITIHEVSAMKSCYLLNSVRGFHAVTVAYSSVSSCSSL